MALPPFVLGNPEAAAKILERRADPAAQDPGEQLMSRAPLASMPDDMVDPRIGEFGEQETGATDDIGQGVTARMDADMSLRTPAMPRGPGTTTFSGENIAAVGGPDPYQAAFKVAPEMAAQGLNETATATADEGNALAAQYKRQAEQAAITAADVQRRRENNDAELMRREEELKGLTQKYTQDLADTGKFWRSPGNIISAIAYMFSPLGGGGVDSGVRLIDAAIQGDLKNRKQLADMHLGELRSNLSGYRAIAKDKEAGDLLAQSEAYRIAALQVEQIGQSFKGQKAQAAMKTMIADLMQKSNLTAMEFFRRYVYINPQAASIPIVKEYMKQPGFVRYGAQPGEGAVAPDLGLKAMPGQGGGGQVSGGGGGGGQAPGTLGAQSSGGIVQGQGMLAPGEELLPGKRRVKLDMTKPFKNPDGTTGYPPVVDAKGQPVYEWGPGPTVSPASEQPTGGPGRGGLVEKKIGRQAADDVEERLPGAGRILTQGKALLNVRVRAKVGANNPPGSDAWLKAEDEIIQSAQAGMDEIAKLTAKDQGGITAVARFQQDLRDIEAAFGGDEEKINKDFLKLLRGPGGDAYRSYEDFTLKLGFSDRQAKAALRFRQVLGKNINAYFKDTSGGAVSESEQTRLNQLISTGASWAGIKNFAEESSRDRAKAYVNAVSSAGKGGDALTPVFYLIANGQKFPRLNSAGKKPKGQ